VTVQRLLQALISRGEVWNGTLASTKVVLEIARARSQAPQKVVCQEVEYLKALCTSNVKDAPTKEGDLLLSLQ
jgi:hypothetical protein